MESSDGRYGWAADDPRWTDESAGGRGRLEPSPPPLFGASTSSASPDAPAAESTTGDPDDPVDSTNPVEPANPVDSGEPADSAVPTEAAEPAEPAESAGAVVPTDAGVPTDADVAAEASEPEATTPPGDPAPRPVDLPPWPPPPISSATAPPPPAGSAPEPLLAPVPPPGPAREPTGPPREPRPPAGLGRAFPPPTAPPPIPPPTAPPYRPRPAPFLPTQPAPVPPPPIGPRAGLERPGRPLGRDLFGPPLAIGAGPSDPSTPGNGYGVPEPPGSFMGAASVPSPVPTSIPLRVHAPLALPAGVEFRTGYGLGGPPSAPSSLGGEVAVRPRTTRLDRRVRIRSRWSTEDEFRRAGRAELFSDDARYRVLFGLTAAWYAPVALVYLVWALLVGGTGFAGVLAGLPWLGAAAGVSLAVSGLLRWASVGWRAITLSAAAAIIGGGITTVAYTLTG